MPSTTSTPPRGAQADVGELLRAWRRRRSLSQLELALDAAVSSRHVSFLETGRARPSREMLLRLAEHLEVPLRERNALLLAAGYAPVYGERPLENSDMEPVRRALDRFLRAHEPYPAIVIDRHHTLLASNDATQALLDGVAPELLAPPANALRVSLHPEGMAPRIANLAQWSAHLLTRLRREAALSGDAELERLHEELAAYPGVATEPPHDAVAGDEVVLPLRLRDGSGELSFFSTISTFGTAVDITLAELSIEAFYPADAHTANLLLAGVAAPPER
jgi:transcriptional regulator with XRE-family HTH domain